MKSRLVSMLIFAVLSLILSACGGQTTENLVVNANKPADGAVTSKNTNQTVVTSITPTSDGQLVKFESAGIQVTMPGSFKVQKEGDDVLVTVSDVSKLYFRIPAEREWEKAFANATIELSRYFKDIKVTNTDTNKDRFTDLMWMKGMKGTGVDKDGKLVEWNLQVFDAPNRALMSVAYGDPKKDDFEATRKDLYKMIQSFKKL